MPRLQLAKVGQYNKETNPEITELMLSEMVETAIDDIPVIPGHWAMPWEQATGWVRAASLSTEEFNGSFSLTGNVDFNEDMATAYENEGYKHWSIAAVADPDSEGKWKLLHLAMLGANLPAIPGLKEIPETIKASYGDDKIKYFTYSFAPKGEDMEKIKELEGKVEELRLELSKTKDNGEKKALELTKEVESLKESNEALELDNKNMKAEIEEYNSKKFNDLMLQLEEVGKGKIAAEDLKELIAEYKESGISCQKEVERHIRIFSKVKSLVPGSGSLVNNEDPEVIAKREADELKARNAGM